MMTDANRQIVRKSTLREQGRDDDLRHLSIEDRLGMMWQLAIDAWAMKGEDVAKQEFQRHVERVIRGRG
jgi:hypothetical protein